MKYTFSIQSERVKFLTEEFQDRIKIIYQDDKWTKLEISIESNLDVLQVFHAGCRAGIDAMMPDNLKN